ncbi:hypothetical protein K438DRAFT_1952843 [Mycena galopus ATCC 62051]|nr:hypothetical protein K438DRAFT_1952843 [Mycena galopus ATCC 62051]
MTVEAAESGICAALKVPTEIWLEIVSDFNFLNLGSAKDGIPRSLLLLSRNRFESSPKTIPPAYRTRPETLRALSQTCRSFRNIFLPLFWDHVESCFTSTSGAAWSIRVADVLLDRCKGLMEPENRALALHVRVFSVSLSSHHIAAIVPLFAQCLQSLPNLSTLHILYLGSKSQRTVTAAFKKITLHAVQTIILPSYAHAILRACPNVRDVSCNEEIGEKLFDTLLLRCPKVERIQGFGVTLDRLNELSKSLPELRQVAVSGKTDIGALSVLKNLSVIELIVKRCEDVEESEIDVEDWSPGTVFKRKLLQAKQKRTEAMRAVLKASARKGPKRIKISYWEDITGMVGMVQCTYGQYWVRAEEFEV